MNSGGMTSTLEFWSLELRFIGTGPVTFFGAQSSLGGHKQWFGVGGGHGTGMLPVAPGLLYSLPEL